MSADGSGGERDDAERNSSKTLLESVLTTLDTDGTETPKGGGTDTLWSLRALADTERKQPHGTHLDGRIPGDASAGSAPIGDYGPGQSVPEKAQPFDGIARLGPALDHRLGTVRRAQTVEENNACRTDVCVFARPDEGKSDEFEEQLCTGIDRWADASGVDGIVPVFAKGRNNGTPWAVTARVGSAVGERNDSLGLSLFHACRLAAALASLHDHGIVHAGIDPGNVVYPSTDDGRPAPAFYNVGLVDVYRRYADPARVLDPRYAAPEYFDRSYGIVDRATDIYQLGALIVTLLSGQPPVDGTPEEVRAATLEGEMPSVAASDSRLPEEIDEILGRATATDPFERYDTADEFRRDLTSLCGRLLE